MSVEYVRCDDCGRLIESGGDDDFHFEVENRKGINVPNPWAVTVCGECWETKGYREEYERQTAWMWG